MLMAVKKAKEMSFAGLEVALGLEEVWLPHYLWPGHSSDQEAEKLVDLRSLDPAISSVLREYHVKGILDPVIPPICRIIASTRSCRCMACL